MTEVVLFVQEKVQQDRYIPMPEEVQSVVGRTREVYGPVVHWNYETNAQYIILSDYPLKDSSYSEVTEAKIYDIDKIGDGRGRIRVPKRLNDVVRSYYFEGARVNYLAHQEMTQANNRSVFLLPNQQLQQILPPTLANDVMDGPDANEIQESLTELPAFISSP